MKIIFWLITAFFFAACKNHIQDATPLFQTASSPAPEIVTKTIGDTNSWAYFLQHLPEKPGPVVDYQGNTIRHQSKSFSIINYDVGSRDLQQCADALMRLRAEYLFKQQRYAEISFQFTSGHPYSFSDYCNGKLPLPKGTGVVFTHSSSHPQNRQSLRRYLDIVYTYAGTISLANELQTTGGFSIGTVVISPGSPGHCFIITDEARSPDGQKLYKLVEGYTPAQSIYVLKNTDDPHLGYWHPLKKGTIETASYTFDSYKLKKFE